MIFNAQVAGMTRFSGSLTAVCVDQEASVFQTHRPAPWSVTDCFSLGTRTGYREELREQFSSKGVFSLMGKVPWPDRSFPFSGQPPNRKLKQCPAHLGLCEERTRRDDHGMNAWVT